MLPSYWAAAKGGHIVPHLLNTLNGCHGCTGSTVAFPGVCHICIVPRGPLDHPAASKEAASHGLLQKVQHDSCLSVNGVVWQGPIMY